MNMNDPFHPGFPIQFHGAQKRCHSRLAFWTPSPQPCCFTPHQKGALEQSHHTKQTRSSEKMRRQPQKPDILMRASGCFFAGPALSWRGCHRTPLSLFSLVCPDSYNPDRRLGGRYRRAAAIIVLFSHLNSERLTNTANKARPR